MDSQILNSAGFKKQMSLKIQRFFNIYAKKFTDNFEKFSHSNIFSVSHQEFDQILNQIILKTKIYLQSFFMYLNQQLEIHYKNNSFGIADINWWTLICICNLFKSLFKFRVFLKLFSASFLMVFLNISVYIFLFDKRLLKSQHFTCSSYNIWLNRYWCLILSSFSHADINHLLCNIASISVFGPIVEVYLGFLGFLSFFLVASLLSSINSVFWHGNCSLGFGGVVYAFIGYILGMSNGDVCFIEFVFDEIICTIAQNKENVDRIANYSGFAFGYIWAIMETFV